MIHRKQITDIVKRITKQERGIRDTKMMHPSREWIVGVSVGCLIFIASALWSIYTYKSNRDVSGSETVESNVEQSLYKEAQVNEALRRISEREKAFYGTSPNVSIPDEDTVATSTVEEVEEIIIEELPAIVPTEAIATTTEDLNIILN